METFFKHQTKILYLYKILLRQVLQRIRKTDSEELNLFYNVVITEISAYCFFSRTEYMK